MKIAQILLTAVATLALSSGLAFADDAINDTCPVKGKSADGSKTVEYTATFCCDKCVAKFEKDPKASAAKVAAAEEGKCPFSGKDVDPEATSTVKIAVCCGGCKKKVTAEPKKYLEELGGS